MVKESVPKFTPSETVAVTVPLQVPSFALVFVTVIVLFAVVCVIVAVFVSAIPEFETVTVVPVPSGSTIVYVILTVFPLEPNVIASVESVIVGASFTIVILYQPVPLETKKCELAVLQAKSPALKPDVGNDALLATIVTIEGFCIPLPASIIEVFESESCIFRLPLSAPMITLEEPVPIVMVLPDVCVNGTFCTIILYSLFFIYTATAVILYQPLPLETNIVLLAVLHAICPAINPVSGSDALLATIVTPLPPKPSLDPASTIEVFDCESCIFRLPLSAPITTLDVLEPKVTVFPVN